MEKRSPVIAFLAIAECNSIGIPIFTSYVLLILVIQIVDIHSDDEELVADKKRIKGGHSDSHATELDEKIEKEKQSQRKESGDGNADSCNGDENDETDEVVSSDSDGRRSQVNSNLSYIIEKEFYLYHRIICLS